MADERSEDKRKPVRVKDLSKLGEVLGISGAAKAGGRPSGRSPQGPERDPHPGRREATDQLPPGGQGAGGGGRRSQEPVTARIPLRQGIADRVPSDLARCHPGLAFSKFVNTWAPDWTAEGKAKYEFFERIRKLIERLGSGAEKDWFTEFRERRKALLLSLHKQGWLLEPRLDQKSVEPLKLSAQWRFVSGLGIPHPFETGFVFDRTYGVPYLPGSSVKGAARAWAREASWSVFLRHAIFGPEKREDREEGIPFEPAQGEVVFFDAYPSEWPRLEVDILNPHYGEYYRDPKVPPADWLSPVPTYFLTLAPDQKLEFVIAAKPDSESQRNLLKQAQQAGEKLRREDLAKKALEAIREAALNLGLGGKTAVGYGYFSLA